MANEIHAKLATRSLLITIAVGSMAALGEHIVFGNSEHKWWSLVASEIIHGALIATALFYTYKELVTKPLLELAKATAMVESESPEDVKILLNEHDKDDAFGRIAKAYVSLLNKVYESNQQLRLTGKIFNSSHDSIIITTHTGDICAANHAFETITGYTSAEVLGKNPRILNAGRQSPTYYKDMWEKVAKTGFWAGEIWNRKKDGSFYAGWLSISKLIDDKTGEVHYIGVTSDITEQKVAHDRVHQLAYYDPLTKLPNRALLKDRLEMAISTANREKRNFSILFIDIDNFKRVNDELGHRSGDVLLETIANKLKAILRDVDTVARFGGDEFVVLLQNVDRQNTKQLAMKIVSNISENYTTKNGEPFSISASVGISTYPSDALDGDTLLKYADIALYKVKGLGKKGYSFYSEEAEVKEFCSLFMMDTALYEAMVRSQLKLFYQPQFDAQKNKVVSSEALIRWMHPEHGLILPDTFIQFAEDSGLIVQIGEYVLSEACKQVKVWQDMGIEDVVISINVSANQLEHEKFVEVTKSIIESYDISPSCIEMELTERAVMSDITNATEIMHELSDFGIRFALDDFGAGYSCLAYLCKLPLHKIKIDKSFVGELVTNDKGRGVVTAIINMATSLGLTVVAEGVETQSQYDILTGQGCHVVQGYYFSRAVSPAECGKMLMPRVKRADEIPYAFLNHTPIDEIEVV